MEPSSREGGASRSVLLHAERVHDRVLRVAYRRRLFESVEAHQGAHLRELARRAMIPLGTTLYHLDRLQSCGLVVARRDGRYKRYFAGHSLGNAEKEMLITLRHAVPRRIAIALLEVRVATQRQLRERVGVSLSTLSLHASQLVGRGILRRESGRREGVYLLQDAELAKRMLESYGASLDGAVPLRILAPLQALPLPGSLGAPTLLAPAGSA
jgi:predicted transcriptional regulator